MSDVALGISLEDSSERRIGSSTSSEFYATFSVPFLHKFIALTFSSNFSCCLFHFNTKISMSYYFNIIIFIKSFTIYETHIYKFSGFLNEVMLRHGRFSTIII